MFALKPRLEIVFRVLLTAMILFNALATSSTIAKAEQPALSSKNGNSRAAPAMDEYPCKTVACSDVLTDPFNSRLAIQVNNGGRFNMGAFPDPQTGGATTGSWDLMYAWPSGPGTSYTTFRIDGVDYVYGSTGTQIEAPTDIDSNTNQSTWQIGDIEIIQTLQLAFNNQTSQEDVAKISYTVRNTGSISHTVGTRIMIDTEINYNDGAPFRVPGTGIVTAESEYIGSAMPDTFQAFFDVTDSEHVAVSTIKTVGEATPDRLVLAGWPNIVDAPYDYSIDPNYDLTDDSAYAVYWDPTPLAPGNEITNTTYYGLGQLNVDLEPPLALGVTGPATLSVVNNQYSPNPFDVVATVFNNGTAATTDVQLTLSLPAGLSLASGSATQTIGDLAVGQERQVSWSVSASPQTNSTIRTYSVTATAFNIQSKTVSRDVTIPALYSSTVSDASTYSSDCGPDSGISCTAECTQGNVGGPLNTRTGGYDYSATDITIQTSAGPLTFARSYSSLTTGIYTSNLGYGWTHNQDMYLSIGAYDANDQREITLKGHTANQYTFTQVLGSSNAIPDPGIYATLTQGSTAFVLTDAAQNQYEFDLTTGKLLSFSDANSHAWNYVYDANGRLERVSADGGARYLELSYDAQGRIDQVSDHTGRFVTYHYDVNGDLDSFTDVLGQAWTYEYHPTLSHLLTRAVTPDNKTIERTEYYPDGRAWRQFDGEGNLVVELTYNTDGTTTVRDGLNNISTYTYDYRGTLVNEENAVGGEEQKQYDINFRETVVANEAGHTLQMTWSADGVNLLSKTDPEGNQTDYTYDSLNNLTSVTDPLNNTTTYTYNGKLLMGSEDPLGGETAYTYTLEGYLESVTDAAGRETSYTYDSFGQRTSMTDPSNNTWTYTYDSLGRLIDTTDPRGRVTHNEYNPAGKLVRVTQNYDAGRPQNDQNLYNIVTDYAYDVRGNQISVTDTYGRTTQYVYDDADRLLQTIDPAGNTTTNTYDAAGRLVSTKDPLLNETTYEYDAAGRLIKTVNALGFHSGITTFDVPTNTSTVTDLLSRQTVFHYDDLGRVVQVVDPLGNSTTTTYDENGNVKTRTDQLNRTTTYEYDELNRLVRTIDPNNGVTETVYNAAGYRTATIDPLLHQTTYTYDSVGHLIATTDPLGRVTHTVYDTYGRRSATIDAAGNETTYTYDLLDRVIAVTDPAGNTTSTTYDALGNVLTRTDANGNVTTTTYDALYRPYIVTDANGNSITNAYDAAGNLISVTDALGNVTTYTYDALNRRVSVTDPLNHTTYTSYDSLGNLLQTTDANGVITRYEYDALNRQVAVILNYKPGIPTDAQTNVRYEFAYNAVGNRTSVKDPNGNVTTYGYDALNRVTSKSDPLTNTWSYTYNLAGSRISATDAKGQTIQYTYDAAGQLTGIDYPGTEPDVAFTYDLNGQRLSMTDGLGTTTWIYDNLNRPISVTDALGKTISYDYDGVGNRTELTYPDGKTVAYAYDDVNQLTGVTDWENQNTGYVYDDAGRLTSVSLPNGVTSQYSFDNAGRLTTLQHNLGASPLASYNYTYDPAGNRTQAIESVTLPSENEAPQFDLGSDAALDEGGQFTGSIPFTDPDSTEWQLTVDYGDGATPTQTTLYAEGNLDLAHVYAEDGTYTLSVTLNDNEGGETSDSILVTVTNLPPVVNAGSDQSVNVNDTIMVNASYSDAGIQDTHTATINWGDGNSEPVNATPTGAGTGTVSAQHAYASTGNFTVEVCVTDSDNSTGCDTILVEVISSGTGTTEIKIGETFIMYYDDSGNGEVLIAQHTTLSQEATLQSLSFYVTQAAGNLRLGFYNDNNGNPGSLVAATDEFTPVAGWNTQNVQSPVLLLPGEYWLAFLPESNDLHAPYGWPGPGQETGRYYGYPYGELPATFSSLAGSGEFQFSFYATFTVAAEPGTIYVGEVNVLHADAGESSNLLIAQQTQLTHTATVQSLSFFVTNAVGKLRLGIYDDGWDGPGALMAQTDEFTPVVGWNTVSVQTPTLLPSGTYWLAFLPESDDLWFKYEWVPGLYTGRIYGYPFGEMPSIVTDQPIGVEYRYSFYATFIEDDSVYTPATALLDDFNRADGAIGSNWSGETSEVGITSNQLTVNSFDTTIGWNNEPFGADQEAYVTFSQLNTSAYNDQGLALKMQSNGTLEDGALVVSYDGWGEHFHVYTYDDTQGWVQYGNDIYVTFTDGDLLGVRARADGIVEVYRNEDLVAVRNITNWPYYAQGGYIGLSFYAAEGAVVDDFGGGTLPGGEMMMASTFSTLEAGPQPEGSIEFGVMASQFNPGTDLDRALLQTTSTVSGQTAYVTIAKENAGEIALDRSQSHRSLKDGDLRVLFDMAGQRIQILKYDSQKGWVQVGKDISVRFNDGDRFRIFLRDDGKLEIYSNGKLLTRQKISAISQQDVGVAAMPPSTASYQQVSYRPTDLNLSGLDPVLSNVEGLPPLLPLSLPSQQTTSLTIDYTYDALNRLTGATYSDGRSFGYAYDAAGNVLELQQNLGPGTVTTTYAYNTANELVTAQVDSTTWNYTYDANGSLTEVLPNGNPDNGAKRYTYNVAGNLVQVETHNGTAWSTQAEMDYNGLGQRLSMDAAGVIAYYVMDGNRPLTSDSAGNTTFFLYGRGIIGEKTTDWNFSLPDGTNTPRQLSDISGDITLSARYTPWGNSLELHGTGNFTFGYIGSILDTATGLLYVGNGQYYDPSTGRFLTRGVNPDVPNPYVPWNPIGAIIGPLALFSLVARRRKSKANPYLLMLLMLVVLPLSVGLACGSAPTPAPTEEPPSPSPSPAPVPSPTPTPSPSPSPAPSPTDPPDQCQGCTSTPTPGLDAYGIRFEGGWSSDQQSVVFSAVSAAGGKFSIKLGGITSASAFAEVYGTPFTFYKAGGGDVCEGGQRKVVCYAQAPITERLLVHELGHALQHSRYTNDTQGPYASLENAQIVDYSGSWVTGKHPEPGGVFERTSLGYLSEQQPDMFHGPRINGQGFTDWNSNEDHRARNEDFADMFMNWVYNSFDYSPSANGAGIRRYEWMDSNMLGWITG